MSAAPLTGEHYRILRAAADGLLWCNGAGRWTIEGQERPDRRARERLMARGLIDYGTHTHTGRTDHQWLVITAKGREVLG